VKMNQIDVISKHFYPGHYTDAVFLCILLGAYISYKCCLFMRAYLLYGTPCLHARTPKINNVACQLSASVEEVRSPLLFC
jgi:hypothetical protein